MSILLTSLLQGDGGKGPAPKQLAGGKNNTAGVIVLRKIQKDVDT